MKIYIISLVTFLSILLNDINAQIIWSSDFSSPGQWSISQLGTNSNGFQIVNTPNSIPIYPYPMLPTPAYVFNSNTATNGFLFVDADAYGNSTSFNDIVTEATMTNAINCSQFTNVKLKFSHNYFFYNDTRKIKVSNNNGITWTDFNITGPGSNPLSQNPIHPIYGGIGNAGLFSNNPETTVIDISSVAAGQANVLVKFYYSDENQWALHWAVDDVVIYADFQNDLKLEKILLYNTQNQQVAFSKIPLGQVGNYRVKAVVKNIGTLSQSNGTVQMTQLNNAVVGTVNLPTILPGQSDTIEIVSNLTTNQLGNVSYNFSVSTPGIDQNLLNNALTNVELFNVTSSFYYSGGQVALGGIGSASLGPSCQIGNIFDINNNTGASGISFYLKANYQQPWGVPMRSKMYELQNNIWVLIHSTSGFLPSSSNVNNMYTIPFNQSVPLNGNSKYLVSLSYDVDYHVATSGESVPGTALMNSNDPLVAPTWFNLNCQPMIGLNLCPVVNFDTLNIATCPPYTSISGTNYFVSGNYIEHFENNVGCDTLVQYLNINFLNDTSYFNAEVCTNGTYVWNGTNYNAPGTYQQQLTNQAGCDSLVFMNLTNTVMPNLQICIVGVDSITGYNRVVWNKPISQAIDSFYVYRESTVGGTFSKIGSVHYDSLSVFLDTNSNPNVQSYQYKIALKDTCGIVSMISTSHKTIHLTINAGLSNTWNLLWNQYQGITFPSYNIYRGVDSSSMNLIAVMPSTSNSYTDLSPPLGQLYYQIEIVNPNNCSPTKNIDYSSSKSNFAFNGISGLGDLSLKKFEVFPNPAKDVVTCSFHSVLEQGTIELVSLDGKILLKKDILANTENVQLNLDGIQSGMYFIRLSGYNEVAFVKY